MNILKAIGKNSFRYILAIMWCMFAMAYITAITFMKVPELNMRIADSVHGFIMGTVVSAVMQFYFGSSQGSADKTELLKGEKTSGENI